MKRPTITNVPASVQSRLMNLSRRRGRPYDETLQYYGIERFLYRLGKTKYRDNFVLKGALLFQVWGVSGYRPTRDIDLLGKINNRVDSLIRVIREICRTDVEDDGILFDPESVRGERITEDADYEGVRIRFEGRLGRTHLHLQVDIGFSDLVSPAPKPLKFPALLGMPSARLRSYPPESVVAEKLQATVYFGLINSRMKDFYDLWMLAKRFPFSGAALQKAIAQTFKNRGTPIPDDVPALTEGFAAEKQSQWRAFLSRGDLSDAPTKLADVLAFLRAFALPVLESCSKKQRFSSTWSPGGRWSRKSKP